VLTKERGRRFLDALDEAGVETTTVRLMRNIEPGVIRRLLREMRSFNPDVVHTHFPQADLHALPAARMLHVATVSSMHSTPSFYCTQPANAGARLIGALAMRHIAISEHVAAFLVRERLASADRIRTIYYGIDATGFAIDEPTRSRARAIFGVQDGQLVVGVASRLIPGKGHETLLDALADAAHECPNLRLLIAGDGPQRGTLESRVDREFSPGVVSFVGFLDYMRDFLAACDVFVIPTAEELGEGFGLAALEAMAAGRAVIATAAGSLPEVVVDGRTGIVVPPSSITALKSAILQLARNTALRERFGAAGAQRARAVFTVEPMVSKTMAVYEELA
jgi:glycosyltransferase involved in cell wall biosynthesis